MIDDQLPPEARALLDAGRDRMGPDAATVARLRARVGAAIIAAPISASAASATPAASAAPAAATTTAAVAAKSIAVKLLVLATVGTTAYVAHDQITRSGEDRTVDAPIVPSIATHEANSDTDVQPSIAITAPVAVEEPPPPEAPAPAAPTRRPPPVVVAPEPAPATLSREIELVDRAALALRTSDFAAALATLRSYDSETAGAGQLAQDAAALHVEALCRTHDSGAARELAAFDQRWPRSAQRSHLTSVCTEVTK